MDAVERVLAMLGAIAVIMGVVVVYHQYRSRREPPSGVFPAPAEPPPEPPAVRRLVRWLVVETVITLSAALVFLVAVALDLDVIAPELPPIPIGVTIGASVIGVAAGGVGALPLAVRWGRRLRQREARIRTRLLGLTAADLFGAVAIVILEFLVDPFLTISTPVRVIIAGYLVFVVLSGAWYLFLLLHQDIRRWVDTGPHVRAG